MRYYRCKCGRRESWGSYHPAPCESCPDCGVTLEDHPAHHRAPAPHRFWASIVDGKLVVECVSCHCEGLLADAENRVAMKEEIRAILNQFDQLER